MTQYYFLPHDLVTPIETKGTPYGIPNGTVYYDSEDKPQWWIKSGGFTPWNEHQPTPEQQMMLLLL